MPGKFLEKFDQIKKLRAALKDPAWRRRGKLLLKSVFALVAFLIVVFPFYLWNLYNQLEQRFSNAIEFVPTRIYADVTRIAPPQPRTYVRKRLKALGYSFDESDENISFKLHDTNYPDHLIPEKHITHDIKSKRVELSFDGPDAQALLQGIETDLGEISDLYLEPELVATLSRSEDGNQIRDVVRFEEFPALVWKAIIAVEDQHFLDHQGFDIRGLIRAVVVNLASLSFKQGGSTITQQLVKNLMVRRTKNLFKKINELFLSILLEMNFEKEQILSRYLNEVYLGQIGNLEVHGVAEGAKYFFGKKIGDLNLGEISMLAGLIRGPGYYSPYRHFERAKERQEWVLSKMVETGHIAPEERDAALKQPIRLSPPPKASSKAPFFVDFVKAQLIDELKERMSEEEISDAGFRVYTTLHMEKSSAAQKAVQKGVARLEERFELSEEDDSNLRLEGALAAVDHRTGYVRALVGGKNYGKSSFNRILNMKRQVGSTFKPIVYLSALQQREDPNGVAYGPAYPMLDAPWELVYDRSKISWKPRNFRKEYQGWTSLRKAIALSVNVVAAKLGTQVGFDNIIETAKQLGIESEIPPVPSMTLGVTEMSPVELLKVYSTFANHGKRDQLTVIRSITEDDGTSFAKFIYQPEPVVAQAYADAITDMLQSVFIEGTASHSLQLGFERSAAGKTGTTNDHRDAWFAGYTPELTTVVWVGFDKGIPDSTKSKYRLTGGGSAFPIWTDFMNAALESVPPTEFPLSDGLSDVRIDLKSGLKALPGCPDAQIAVERYVYGQEPVTMACETSYPESISKTEIN